MEEGAVLESLFAADHVLILGLWPCCWKTNAGGDELGLDEKEFSRAVNTLLASVCAVVLRVREQVL